jgi:hypothetical protein
VDKLYGSIENPDTGVPDMGNGAQNVMVGAMGAYRYLLPATHWVAHMASGLLQRGDHPLAATPSAALRLAMIAPPTATETNERTKLV